MHVQEDSVLWDPIPEYANVYWMMLVSHVEEIARATDTGFEGLAITITSRWSPKDRSKDDTRKQGIWRLKFTGVTCYRRWMYDDAQPLSITRPDEKRGLWEIAPSRYIAEYAAIASKTPMHHFVILSGDNVIHEVLADTWTCDELPVAPELPPFGRLDGAGTTIERLADVIQAIGKYLEGRGYHAVDIVSVSVQAHDQLNVNCVIYEQRSSASPRGVWLQAYILADGTIDVIAPDDLDFYV